MVKILFVCLGNICRSTMAEGVFRHLVEKEGLSSKIQCDSAGTAAYHIGEFADPRTLRVLANNGIKLSHLGRQISKKDFQDFDIILAMDNSIFQDILAVSPDNESSKKVFLFRDFDKGFEGKDVPDPYYGNMDGFNEVYEITNRGGIALIDYIYKNFKIKK